MKLILVMVISLDGRSIKGNDPDTHSWTSVEDQNHFAKIIDTSNLLIMGSTTYEAARNQMQHRDGRKRVVLTRNPDKYDEEKIKDQLEFSNEDPKELLQRLESEGFAEGYLLGGAHTNTEFFKQNLVNELWLTLEPKILGAGNGIVGEENTDFTLTLLSSEKLNNTGTLLLKYRCSVNS